MDLNANSISIIEKTKNEFEDQMKAKMVNDTFRNIVTKAVPLKDGELDKIDNPEFKAKFSSCLSEVSRSMVDQFSNVAQFDTGNLFTSMVTSITDSVSLEADYRMNKLIQNIRLGKINQSNTEELNTAVYKAFENRKSFESADVGKRFIKDIQFIFSTEAADDVIDRIKNDVKDAIEETETKNELVEGTTQEIIDYKNEVAPPDDQYQDPNAPADPAADPNADPNAAGGDVPTGDGTDATADVSDDGMTNAAPADGTNDQIYEDDGTGTAPTDDGTGGDAAVPDPNAPADPAADPNADPNAAGGDVPTGDGADATADPNAATPNDDGTADMSDMSDGTTPDATGTDPAADPNAVPEGADSGEANTDVGGTDGVVDQGDVGKTVDPALGAPAGGDAASAPGVSDGNSNNNSGGITININGADLKATKESLDLFSPRSLAEKRIPLHPKTFNNYNLPSIEDLSAECVNAGEGIEKEMKYRLDGLKYATKQANLSKESIDTINDKINSYGKIIGTSITNAKNYEKTLESMGITAQGIIFSNENTLCIARNIINRFLARKQFVSPTVRPYTSKENVFANAFDIVQLRQYVNSHESAPSAVVDDLFARESLFYHNMVNYDDEEVKKQATAVIDLSQMNFKKAMSPNFITDYRIKAWELNVGDKANKDVNEEVVKRVKDKFEKLWLRDLNADEMKIIRGAANQEDVTELTPTPYEKFIITMTKESMNLNNGQISDNQKKDIEWKSRLMTTVYKTAEAFGAFDSNDNTSFEKFTNMVGM